MGWIRTYHDGARWYWRSATEEELAAAHAAGVPVHSMFGPQPSRYDRI